MNLLPSTQTQIAAVAQGMLCGDIGIVDGCRQLVRLYCRLDEGVDELFALIVAVESETEDLPLGEARSQWSEEALSRKDAEVNAYIGQVREVVLEACEALVQRYSGAAL